MRNMMNLKQIMELYNAMKDLIIRRQEDDKLEELQFSDFIEWINKLKKKYIDEDETEEFYKYVEDSIFDTVCYE
jgi:hypothetical protein